MIPKPLTDAAQALLTRLDDAYDGVDPTDIDAVTALWTDLLTDDTLAQEATLTTETHIAGLERRIAEMERTALDYDKAANLITGTSPAHVSARKLLQHSADSCRADADKCRAKIAALRGLAAAA